MASRRRLALTLLFLALPTALVVLAVVALMAVRITTKVEVTLHANAVWFEIGELAEEWVKLTSPASVSSLGVERFGEMTYEPERLEIGDWEQYDFVTDRFADDAWKPLTVESRRITMTAFSPDIPATATIQAGVGEGASPLQVDPLRVITGTSVSLQVSGENNQAGTVKLAGLGRDPIYLKAFDPVQIATDEVRLAGVVASPSSREETSVYRVWLAEQDPKIEVTSRSGSLVLNLRFDREETPRLSFDAHVPLRAIRFSTVVEGRPKTTLVAGTTGKIRYVGYPSLDVASFEEPDFIGLRPDIEEGFWLKKLAWEADSPGMRVELEGAVEHLRTGTTQAPRDRLLTAFDALWHSPKLMILFSIVLWVFPTSLGAYRLYREITA